MPAFVRAAIVRRAIARTAATTCLAMLACGSAQACEASSSPRLQAPAAAPVAPAGIYVGNIGENDTVVLSLRAATNLCGSQLTGSYHHANGADQEVYEVAGSAQPGQRLTLRGSGAPTLRTRGGRFEGNANTDGSTITGTWIAADGRRQPFALQRAAAWTSQAVQAKGGVRSCERPQFTETRYLPVNRELAEACDYFLADGLQGPGTLRLEIDSLGQYMVAAVAYAKSGGRELPPEIIAVDLGQEGEVAQARDTTLARRP